MKTRMTLGILAVLLLASSSAVYAGGPLLIFDPFTRTPYAWGAPPNVFTDLGNNGLLTGAESDGWVAFGFNEWNSVATATFTSVMAGDFSTTGLPDITGLNAGLVVGTFNGDGGIHVMYDDDGSITSNFFGAPPGVLGIASPDFALGVDIVEGWAMINGTATDPVDAAAGGGTFAGVFTHEFGHSINLAHTQTNSQIGFFGEGKGPDACAVPFPDPLTLSDFETMYPFLDISPGSTGEFQRTVDHLDDTAALSNLYPAAGWPANFGTITGKVFAPDGSTEVTGINVIARNINNPYKGAISALSGDFTQGDLGPDGLFTFNGLEPGAEYVLYIDEIVAGGFSTTPGSIPGDGSEEYWNLAESADPGVDAPCDFNLLVPGAGQTLTADIIANGDPNNLNLGDDDYIEVALPFAFPFCGMMWNSVFVGSNGFLTFGQGNTDFSESVPELLSGPPRICGLWDDLNPSTGGTITAMPDGANFVVTYTNVPEFFATGGNTFEITLRPDGSYDIDYGAITATDGLAGRSEGLGAADPGEVDLTVEPQPIGPLSPTVYEQFTAGDNDLDSEFLAYAPCTIPDLPEIVVWPTSLSALLLPGETAQRALTIKNLGDLDLNWVLLTNQDLGAPAGGMIPKLDLGDSGDPVVLDQATLARMTEDRAGSNTGKPDVSPLKVPLPHIFALNLLTEDFNSGFPAGWTVVDNVALGVSWMVPQQGEGNYTGGSGDAAGASSDFTGSADFDTELRTPEITGFGTNVVLSYVANYQNFANFDFFDVDVSTDGGANWTNVLSWNEDHGGFFGPPGEQVALNLDPFVQGATSFMVRWRYYDPTDFDFDWYVQIDDVSVVSDEILTPCAYLTASPTAGTLPGDGMQDVDVTFDATGFTPGTYDCEIIIVSNAFNEPRLVVPVQMIVAQEAALDIKPGSCPNPFQLKLFEWAQGGNSMKGGVLPVALVGDMGFDVADVDISSILLEGVAPLDKGSGPTVDDVATPYYASDCSCLEATGDGVYDIMMHFSGQEIALAINEGAPGDEVQLSMVGQLNNGLTFIARDCIRFVGKSSSGGDPEPPPAASTALGVATPNPFNPVTNIGFSLAAAGKVDLSIYDVKGRRVSQLVSGTRGAGDHIVTWNAQGLPSGIYFYRLTAGNFTETRKIVLLK